MQTYLVEAYVPRLREPECQAAAERAREAAGDGVRYVRTLFVAEDETCFHVLEGRSADAVRAVSRRAGIDYARIVRVTLDGDENETESPQRHVRKREGET